MAATDNLVLDKSVQPNAEYMSVRVGLKWFEAFHYDARHEVWFVNKKGKTLGKGFLLGVDAMPLGAIPERYLPRIADPKQHTLAGLLKHLRKQYGDNVNPDTYVSVVFFMRESD
jgi:hypothetical protein